MTQWKKYISNWKKWLLFKKKSVLLSVLLFISLFGILQLTKIKSVYCYCDGQVCEQNICSSVSAIVGKNYLSLNKRKIIAEANSSGKYEKVDIKTKAVGVVTIDFHTTSEFLIFNSMVTSEKIALSIDTPPVSTLSANIFQKPSSEIMAWASKYNLVSLKVYPAGFSETAATISSQIIAITTDKKTTQWYESMYKLIKIVLGYANVSGVYLLDNNVYFAQVGQPDIIISTDYQEEKLTKTLQSLGFLTTIKKDPKIIDLRYANPIIR
jgi:hypothetical protein